MMRSPRSAPGAAGDVNDMPGPAPPVVNGLQIDQALPFQRRFHLIQRVAWSLLALVPVAAVLGLFGGGLLGETSAGSRAAGVTVSYDRFARMSADTELELRLERADGPSAVSISRSLLDQYDISEIRPEPERVITRPDRIEYVFAASASGTARFAVQPSAPGSASGMVAVHGGSPVRVRQLVFP
jgi:hypothetical protein